MRSNVCLKISALFLGLIFVASAFSLGVFAADVDESKLRIYQVISEQSWQLAPGITESEIVLNNSAGNKRQLTHVVEIDVTNPYTKVIPSYKGMAEGINAKEYGTQIMSEQAKYAEENGYGNVVAAMNTCLHWYDTAYYEQHPELIGEPLGTLILNGVKYTNSQNSFFSAYTCIVINFDEKDGQSRPDNIPKVQVRQTYDAITGWEEQLIPASFHFLVKDGVNQHTVNDPEPYAPRSMMGVKSDGTLVLAMVDGRQAPVSTGFNAYEMAEYMISLGCVQAINCDGGGSSTFLSQRPGEDLELHCYPSDGDERPVTQGVLVISTAHICEYDSEDIITPATCTTDGVKTNTCTCGETMTNQIKAPGHVDENDDKACDICGESVTVKNGVVRDSDGHVRYYVNGVATRAGLVADSNGNYYYVNSSLKAVKNCYYAFSAAMSNGLLPAGEYQFGADGKMINAPAGNAHVHAWGEGVLSVPTTCPDGGIITYICECGLSKTDIIEKTDHIDEDKDLTCDICKTNLEHKHVWDEGVITTPASCTEDGVKTYTCNCGETKTEAVKSYGSHIDENGDLSCDRCSEKLSAKTGLVFDSDGNIRYYENGVSINSKGLVQDSQGNYYYINSTRKAVKSCTYAFSAAKSNGLLPAGEYRFGADGKMIAPPSVEAPHQHAWANGVVTTPASCTEDGIKTYTCNCGETNTETVKAYGSHIDENGDLSCDRCSEKLSAKTGLVFDSDGNVRYYENGVSINSKGLVQDSQGNYYYINSSRKAVKNCTYAFSAAKSNGLLPAGEYRFDADGKLILN